MQQNIRLEFDTPALFSLSSIRAGQEAVFDLSVLNLSEFEELPLTMEISSEPAFFSSQVHSLGVLAPKTRRIIPDLKFSYDRTLFSYMEENVTCQITVRLTSGGEEILSVSRACDLLRHDAWGGIHFFPEFLSSLVCPMQTQVQDVARACRRRLKKNKVRLDSEGYPDSMNLEMVRNVSTEIYSAAYDAVRAAGVIFSIHPPELTRRGASVQLPEVTLSKKSGNALEAAVLYASCIEAMSLNPVIVLSAGCILVGGFLEPKSFVSPVVDQHEMLKEAVESGALCLFEANALAKGTSLGFSTACQIGQKACRDLTDFYLALDIFACREQGIASLDNRVLYEDGIHFEKPGLSDEEDIFFNDTAIEEASPDPFNQHLKEMRRFLADFSPYNSLISHPEKDRIRILITEPERFYESLTTAHVCPLLSSLDAPFGFRADEAQSLLRLDQLDKQSNTLSDEGGELCLAFGLLKWKVANETGEGPLFLLPVSLKRERGRLTAFTALFHKPKLNLSLLSFLSEHCGVNLSFVRDMSGTDLGDYLKKAFFRIRSELANHPALTLLDQEVFFTVASLLANAKLSSLTAQRLEANPLSRAVCAHESVGQETENSPKTVDAAPASMPTPYPMDREALSVCAAFQTQDYTLVQSPACGGKSHLGVALAFSALNHSEQTVLYITGERGKASDVLQVFAKAGIDDLAAPLSVQTPAPVNYQMRETQMFPAEEYFSLSAQYSEEQKRLMDYETILSERLACGCTPEEAIYCFDHVRSAADCLHFLPETVGKMDEKTANSHQQIIRNLKNALSAITTPVAHPLRYVQTRGFSYEIKAEAVHLLDEYSKKFKEYITFLRGSCAGLFPKAKIHNEYHEKAFLNLLRMIGDGRGINACYFEREIAASDLAKVETIFAYGRECCEMRETMLSGLNPVAFDLPVKEMIVAWRDADLKRGGARRKTQREISQKLFACCADRKEINVLETLYQIEKYLNYRTYLSENAALIQRLFGVDILAPQNDTPEIWTHLAQLCRDCVTFDRQLGALAGEAREDAAKLMRNFTEEDASRAASLCEGILELRAEMEKIRDRFLRYLEIDDKSFRAQFSETLYDEIPKMLREIAGGMDSFQEWTEWLCASDIARSNGFDQVLEAVESGALNGDNLEDAYARAFFMALCEYVFLKYPLLGELRAGAFDEKLSALSETRHRIYDLAQQDIRSKHLRRYTSFLQDSGLETDRVEALTPALFAENTYAITCRYPVLVANAEDAVRFLEDTPARFHLLILDDAQTLSIPSALSLIPRSEKVAILGTPAPEDAAGRLCDRTDRYLKRRREEIPSFWTAVCTALPAYQLRYSRQRTAGLLDAVTTAAKCSYSSFPFAAQTAGVRQIRTPGQYDPLTFVNLPEMMQTVDEILLILKAHLESEVPLSLGVCASTVMQKQLILQTLAKRLREQPELYAVLREAREPFYVSALSDEPLGRRDVILWSMTIAPTKSTNLPPRSFPLLSDLNGARRILSVLSAARRELCVLHSIHSDSLDLLRLSTPAHATFRRVCRSIFSGCEDVRAVVDSSAAYDNPIAERIASFLQAKGCAVSFSVRGGKFGIDLVARHPQFPDFALAVLLDETVFSVCSGHILGEVDLMNSLRSHGFSPIHVRATDWFENDQIVLEAIASLLPGRGKNSLDARLEK